MAKLSDLPNIGNVVESQLNEVGINTPEELEKTGSKEAWLKIQSFDPSACYNRLCALEGAIRGVPKKNMPEDVKSELKEFYQEHKLY